MWRELSGGVRKVPATLFQREIGRAKIRRTEEGPSFRRRAVWDLADASAVQFPDFTSVYGRGRRATQQVTRSAGHVPGDSAREVIWIGGSGRAGRTCKRYYRPAEAFTWALYGHMAGKRPKNGVTLQERP